ncbi:MAG: hypothetical protein AAF926_09040 [Pseudomonadota bacterium]
MPIAPRNSFKLAIAGLGLIVLSACATTGSSDSETTQVAMAEAPAVGQVEEGLDPNEEVCKRVKQTTTRFTKKMCFTRQQWADMAAEARRGTANTQQRAFDNRGGN